MNAAAEAIAERPATPPAAGSETVVHAHGLTKRYKNAVALDGADFQVGNGRIVGLIGPNGAGKTTALKAILGLTDFEGGYTFAHGVKFSMGANNVFNIYPNKNPYAYRYSQLVKNSSGYATQYSAAPYGYNGGFYYGRLTWIF